MSLVWVGVVVALAVVCWPRRVRSDAVPTADSVGARWSEQAVVSPAAASQTVAVEDSSNVATAIDLLGLALSSGVPLTGALAAVAEQSGPLVGAQLRQVSAALHWGVDEAKAWQGLPQLWRPAASALALAARVGMPASGLLHSAAEDLRHGEQQALQERTARLGVLIVLPLGGCFLPAFAVLTVLPVVAVIARGVLSG